MCSRSRKIAGPAGEIVAQVALARRLFDDLEKTRELIQVLDLAKAGDAVVGACLRSGPLRRTPRGIPCTARRGAALPP